ncbi:Uncharacterised protein [Streptococcus pneumoniae]|nr:Uncharacterised protein [Streptococcus pneumoniae]CIW24861.1 Uncharacterised protein [Streptococcus pneumoniae]
MFGSHLFFSIIKEIALTISVNPADIQIFLFFELTRGRKDIASTIHNHFVSRHGTTSSQIVVALPLIPSHIAPLLEIVPFAAHFLPLLVSISSIGF